MCILSYRIPIQLADWHRIWLEISRVDLVNCDTFAIESIRRSIVYGSKFTSFLRLHLSHVMTMFSGASMYLMNAEH